MNLSELSVLVSIGAGAAGGASADLDAGIIGGVGGFLAGAVIGYATAFVFVFLPMLLLVRKGVPTDLSRLSKVASVAVIAAAMICPFGVFFLASHLASWAAAALS